MEDLVSPLKESHRKY